MSNSSSASPGAPSAEASAARHALALLLIINLFNYVDRQVLAAVVDPIQRELLPGDPNADQLMGWLAPAFMISYMLLSPLFGWLGDRYSRWKLIAAGVVLWSLACGASGLAGAFAALLLTRVFVGVGEAAYGPTAPALLSDLYPVSVRGRVLSWFYMAIPVGSALGFVLGGVIAAWVGWRYAFYAVVAPGVALGLWAFLMKDPPRGAADHLSTTRRPRLADYKSLFRTPSYLFVTLGMAAMTFAIGGIGFWMPTYVLRTGQVKDLGNINAIFGTVTVLAGFSGTLLGGMAGDWLRPRLKGAYFLVSGAGLLLAIPMLLLALNLPFPLAWAFVFLAVFWTFFNTGPSNTIIANVTHPSMRASAFALNILVIHALGDAISPPIMGRIADGYANAADRAAGLRASFLVVSALMLLGGALWLWGARRLERDTEAATKGAPGQLN